MLKARFSLLKEIFLLIFKVSSTKIWLIDFIYILLRHERIVDSSCLKFSKL